MPFTPTVQNILDTLDLKQGRCGCQDYKGENHDMEPPCHRVRLAHQIAERLVAVPATVRLPPLEVGDYRPPLWGVWIIDPSGKYGLDRAFLSLGETSAEAFERARARYRPGGKEIQLDTTRLPQMVNLRRGLKPRG